MPDFRFIHLAFQFVNIFSFQTQGLFDILQAITNHIPELILDEARGQAN